MIAYDIIDQALDLCGDKTVKRAVCGSGFTAVQLSDDSVGISFRYPEIESATYAGSMVGRPVADFVKLFESLSLQDSSLSLAVINALTSAGRSNLPGGNLEDHVEIRKTDTVGIIGNFGGMIDQIKERCKKVMVFELYPEGDMLPAWAEPLMLPKCDIVIVTGATLINKTTDGILASSVNAREIILMGPSAIQMPEVFKPRGVTLLAGAEITQGEKALLLVSEGAHGNVLIKQTTRAYYARI